MSFGERLIEAFDGASMAEIAREIGVAHSTVRNYVQQNRLPDAEVLIKISHRTNVSLNWLLTGEGIKSQTQTSQNPSFFSNLDIDLIKEIEEFREFDGFKGDKKSQTEYLVYLIEQGIKDRKLEEDRSITMDYLSNLQTYDSLSAALRQTIVEIMQHEIQWGKSRLEIIDLIRDAFFKPREHPFEAIDPVKIKTFDRDYTIKKAMGVYPSTSDEKHNMGKTEEFDLEKEIELYDNPVHIFNEWIRHDGLPAFEVSAFDFSGWADHDTAGKVSQLKKARQIMERQQERKRNAPKPTEDIER